MSEKCIKTGADVFLENYGKVVHGDLFITAGRGHTYILYVNYDYSNMEPYDPAGGDSADAIFHEIAFERNGVIVANSFDVSESDAFSAFRAKWG